MMTHNRVAAQESVVAARQPAGAARWTGWLTPMLIAAFSISAAEADPRAQFEFFLGTWTVKGYDTTFREVCAWLPGGGFVACNAEDRSDSPPGFSMSVFGYSVVDTQYTYNCKPACNSDQANGVIGVQN